MVRIGLILVLAIGSLAEARVAREERIGWFFDVLDESSVELDPSTHTFQWAGQVTIFLGREDLFQQFVERAPSLDRGEDCPVIGSLAGFRETLLEEAQQTRIVIVNEAHTEARHRLLPAELAAWLAPLGYRYFAAETFWQGGLETRAENSIPGGIGTYSFEPIFARSLRRIEALGYEFVAYEITSEQNQDTETYRADTIDIREHFQAANLVEFLTDHPDAKLLVFVGHGHLLEEPIISSGGQETRMMANRVRELTGIDPVTISQTICRSSTGTAVVDGSDTRSAGSVDHFIAHPPIEFERNRPTWRREIGDIDTDIPAELLSESERIIVEAHPAGGSTEEVAIDRLMLFPGEDIPLLLPPGRYDLRSWTADGLLAGPVEITVAE